MASANLVGQSCINQYFALTCQEDNDILIDFLDGISIGFLDDTLIG